MNIQLQELHFIRDESGKVIFNKKNLETLCKYVIPIIERNRGWSSEALTLENFRKNPEQWRDDIDATVEDGLKAKVFIAMQEDKPVGLLEYISEDLSDLSDKNFSKILWDMLKNRDSKYWKRLLKYSFLKDATVDMHFAQLQEYFRSKRLFKYIGVVLIPELQGKKSGISDILYKSMKNGLLLGSTSTPQVLAKRRKLFKATVFTPLLTQKIKTLDELACLIIIAVRLFAKSDEEIKEEEFGIETHVQFALRDKTEYMQLAQSFLDKKKITELDYRRLDKILNYRKGQGTIVSVS